LKFVPYIKLQDCIGCGICVEVCPVSVFVMSTDKAVVMYPEKCTGCKLCVENCPTGAIDLKPTD
jgi:electron transport complex protein RnfB